MEPCCWSRAIRYEEEHVSSGIEEDKVVGRRCEGKKGRVKFGGILKCCIPISACAACIFFLFPSSFLLQLKNKSFHNVWRTSLLLPCTFSEGTTIIVSGPQFRKDEQSGTHDATWDSKVPKKRKRGNNVETQKGSTASRVGQW